jgi:hypothetical protein
MKRREDPNQILIDRRNQAPPGRDVSTGNGEEDCGESISLNDSRRLFGIVRGASDLTQVHLMQETSLRDTMTA